VELIEVAAMGAGELTLGKEEGFKTGGSSITGNNAA